jgi:FkbM family methyltransferase
MDGTTLHDLLARARNRERTQAGVDAQHWLVYGAGRIGRSWAKALAASGRTVHGFIDRQAVGTPEMPVYRLDDCSAALKSRCAVLLALHNPGVDVAAVQASLRSAGYGELWLLQDMVDAWPEQSHFWLASSSESLSHEADIHRAYERFADEPSRKLFLAILDQRLNGEVAGLPPPDPGHHYLPQDLSPPGAPLRFVDCGAYTGDTIESFRSAGYVFDAIAAFEPDPNHFPKLCAALADEKACVFPCGVWDSMTQMRFASDDSASHISNDGDITVQTVALDQALPGFAPSYIKMDIEGAESQALRGGQAMIASHRPRLAVSIYHRPRDLWELMLQVDRLGLDYQFHLRSHAFNSFETVLYALPK